jgi:cytoskeletal protein RodZ
MDLSEISHAPPAILGDASTAPTAAMPTVGTQPSTTYHQCDECAAPVDIDQRYCVSCGAHRRNVNDPAARYLSHATARSRTSRAVATQKRPRHTGSGARGLGVAVLLALIPAVAAVGVLVGRSSNNQDAKLIQALTRNQAARATSTTPASTATSTGASNSATTPTGAHKAKSHKRSSSKASSAKSHNAATSTTQFGSVSQIAGAKATKAQEQQGAQDAQKVQKSTGKSYVNGQSGLPSTVVIP